MLPIAYTLITCSLLIAPCVCETVHREKRQLDFGGCFNLCSFGISSCMHGGECQVDPNDCGRVQCNCPDEYTGEYCQILKSDTTAQSDNTTISSLPVANDTGIHVPPTIDPRFCYAGFECVNGVCDQEAKMNNDMKCNCEDGWTGLFCDKQVKECFPGFVCVNGYCNINGNSVSCTCNAGWTGDLCSESVVQSSTETPVTFYTFSTTTFIKDEPSSCALPCFHGECDREYLRETGNLRCICDPGYVGDLCLTKCDLDCGENGTCRVLESGYMACVCHPGYSGDRCQFLASEYNDTVTTIQSITSEPCDINCSKHSKCVENNGTFKCECKKGYTGALCNNPRPLEEKCADVFFLCGEHGKCDEEKYQESNGAILRCVCEDGYVGEICDTKCELPCGPNSYCTASDIGDVFCVCHPSWGGDNCTEYTANRTDAVVYLPSDEPTWYWYVVGACVAALILLVVLLVVVPYILWKKRVVFIMKIVYYLKSYEEDDGKKYDAFISYKSDGFDESFVVHTLHPKLENELNFKICVHYRDFMVGETIANNIIRSIDESRRTILIVTPRYLESEWARMEMQKAQHEMLKLKHKIIPIILQDTSHVKDKMDDNLKMILESVTYIEWPGVENEKKTNKFWKQLELTMPKKKKADDSNVCSSDSSNKESHGVKLEKFSRVDENGTCMVSSNNVSLPVRETFVDISLDEPPTYNSLPQSTDQKCEVYENMC